MNKVWMRVLIPVLLFAAGAALWFAFAGQGGREGAPLAKQEEIAAKLNRAFRENEASVRRQMKENPDIAFLYSSEEATVNPLTITYTYKIKEGVAEKSLKMDAGRRDIEKAVCATPQMEPLRKAGTVFRYVYLNREGKPFYEFSVRTPADCR
jgi:hypothetical protein